MLIWQGKGILVLVPALLFGVFQTLTSAVTSLEVGPAWGVGLILGGLAAAPLLWWFDRWLERRNPPRELVDPKTGQTYLQKRRDSFFFVPMRYYPYLYALAPFGGVALLVTA